MSIVRQFPLTKDIPQKLDKKPVKRDLQNLNSNKQPLKPKNKPEKISKGQLKEKSNEQPIKIQKEQPKIISDQPPKKSQIEIQNNNEQKELIEKYQQRIISLVQSPNRQSQYIKNYLKIKKEQLSLDDKIIFFQEFVRCLTQRTELKQIQDLIISEWKFWNQVYEHMIEQTVIEMIINPLDAKIQHLNVIKIEEFKLFAQKINNEKINEIKFSLMLLKIQLQNMPQHKKENNYHKITEIILQNKDKIYQSQRGFNFIRQNEIQQFSSKPLEQFNNDDTQKYESVRLFLLYQIRETQKQFKFITPTKKQLIFTGQAGQGKSTLCLYLLDYKFSAQKQGNIEQLISRNESFKNIEVFQRSKKIKGLMRKQETLIPCIVDLNHEIQIVDTIGLLNTLSIQAISSIYLSNYFIQKCNNKFFAYCISYDNLFNKKIMNYFCQIDKNKQSVDSNNRICQDFYHNLIYLFKQISQLGSASQIIILINKVQFFEILNTIRQEIDIALKYLNKIIPKEYDNYVKNIKFIDPTEDNAQKYTKINRMEIINTATKSNFEQNSDQLNQYHITSVNQQGQQINKLDLQQIENIYNYIQLLSEKSIHSDYQKIKENFIILKIQSTLKIFQDNESIHHIFFLLQFYKLYYLIIQNFYQIVKNILKSIKSSNEKEIKNNQEYFKQRYFEELDEMKNLKNEILNQNQLNPHQIKKEFQNFLEEIRSQIKDKDQDSQETVQKKNLNEIFNNLNVLKKF